MGIVGNNISYLISVAENLYSTNLCFIIISTSTCEITHLHADNIAHRPH
jgi:hypothetical protein